MSTPEFLTPAEVAQRLRISRPAAYRLLREGRIESARFGGRTGQDGRAIRATVQGLEQYIAEQLEASNPNRGLRPGAPVADQIVGFRKRRGAS